jgi:hypothetical protein
VANHNAKISKEGSGTFGADALQIRRLDSAKSYYFEILKPQYDEFFAEPATLRSAFNLAGALFHFRDWLFANQKAELVKHFGVTFKSEFEFWDKIKGKDSRFGFIRDVANSAKHMILKPNTASTSMTHVANTFVVVNASAEGTARPGGDRVKMQDGSTMVDFDDCAKALFDEWTSVAKAIGLT